MKKYRGSSSSEAQEQLMAVWSARVAQEDIVYIIITTILVLKSKISLPPTRAALADSLVCLSSREEKGGHWV